MSSRKCNYCDTILVRFEKNDETGKWKRWDANGNEHTYAACKAIQNNKAKTAIPPEGQAQLPPQFSNNMKFPPAPTPSQQQPTININSVFVKCSNLEKELKEIRKENQTLATIIDGMAQKITLLVQNNYPKPEPAIREEYESYNNKTLQEPKEEAKSAYSPESKIENENDKNNPWEVINSITPWICSECNSNFNKGVQNKIDRKITLCIKCYGDRGQHIDIEAFQKTQDKISDELENDKKSTPTNKWELISQKFVCNECESVFHNGWTADGVHNFCDQCKTNIEANSAWQQMSQNRKPKTIEEINEEEESYSL